MLITFAPVCLATTMAERAPAAAVLGVRSSATAVPAGVVVEALARASAIFSAPSCVFCIACTPPLQVAPAFRSGTVAPEVPVFSVAAAPSPRVARCVAASASSTRARPAAVKPARAAAPAPVK